MTRTHLASRSLRFYWRTNLAVAFGIACAVAVLAGALLVGASVRESLRDLAVTRLGRTNVVITSETPFSDGLARMIASPTVRAVPIWTLEGTVEHQATRRRAAHVRVYGVDDRFFSFHGVPAPSMNA